MRASTLAIRGDAGPAWMRDAMHALAAAIAGSERTLAGQTHDVDVQVLAPALAEFFAG